MLWLCLYPIIYSLRFNSGNNPWEYFINVNVVYFKYFFIIIAVKFFFCGLFFTKIYDSSPHFLYMIKKRSKMFFYNNLGIRALIIYFCFVLIDLINDYKNIYSRNNNVCLVVFMCIDTFKRLLLVWNGLWGYFQIFGYTFFNVVLNSIIFSMKRG